MQNPQFWWYQLSAVSIMEPACNAQTIRAADNQLCVCVYVFNALPCLSLQDFPEHSDSECKER